MKAKIKFYADTPRGESNKLLTFKVNDRSDADKAIERFKQRGYKIRSAYYETYNTAFTRFSNKRIL